MKRNQSEGRAFDFPFRRYLWLSPVLSAVLWRFLLRAVPFPGLVQRDAILGAFLWLGCAFPVSLLLEAALQQHLAERLYEYLRASGLPDAWTGLWQALALCSRFWLGRAPAQALEQDLRADERPAVQALAPLPLQLRRFSLELYLWPLLCALPAGALTLLVLWLEALRGGPA